MKEKWEETRIHGQFSCSLDEKLVDKGQSYWWLEFGDIKGETGSTAVAAEDQALSTYCIKKIFWNMKLKVNCACVKNTKDLLTT
jgi:hypothetical protein